MLVAAPCATHAQTLDAVGGERVAADARQASRAGQPVRRFDLTLDDAVQLDVNETTADNLRDSTLPALDLVGSYQLTGQGGPRRVPAGSSFEDLFGGAGGVIPGGYRDALDSIANADYPPGRSIDIRYGKG